MQPRRRGKYSLNSEKSINFKVYESNDGKTIIYNAQGKRVLKVNSKLEFSSLKSNDRFTIAKEESTNWIHLLDNYDGALVYTTGLLYINDFTINGFTYLLLRNDVNYILINLVDMSFERCYTNYHILKKENDVITSIYFNREDNKYDLYCEFEGKGEGFLKDVMTFENKLECTVPKYELPAIDFTRTHKNLVYHFVVCEGKMLFKISTP